MSNVSFKELRRFGNVITFGRILRIEKKDKSYVIAEQCDDCFECELTEDQFREFINKMQNLIEYSERRNE